MAVYNEILAARFNRALQKMLGMKGPPPTPQLSSEIMPVLPMFYGREHRYLEGWYSFAFMTGPLAVATQQSSWMIRNPVGSAVVAIIEKMTVQSSIADIALNIRQVAQNTDLATIPSITAARMDPRGNPQPVCLISFGNNVALLGTAKFQVSVGANVNQDILLTDIQELPLLPGDAWTVQTVAVNTQLNVSVMWRERPLEDSEKS